ncbi:MAG: hypothetical protein KDA65_19140, partial [Planctomycetaceae bacterium]|nr:hypothetical protein [Planctomycetaceae bacterium]
HNQVKDLNPLSGVTGISSLGLSHNQVEDLSPLKGMTELRYTMMQHNSISDITPLVEMAEADANGPKRFAPYWRLYLKGNPLSEQSQTALIERLKAIHTRVDLERD